MDSVNQKILELLKGNARLSWQSIGQSLGLTGQAISARVQQMEYQGVISGYTVKRDALERCFITVFMNDRRFEEVEKFFQSHDDIEAAYKVAGEGCYQVVLASDRPKALENFLQRLDQFGRCRVLNVLRKVK
ncbi:MAG: AsnC family transcriptional regulator [Aestuariivirga sp.]